MTIKKELSKDERIKKEFNKLRKIFADIQKDRKDTIISLISNIAFMTITLEDLQKAINEKGIISTYQNGQFQSGTKKSPEVEIYNSMLKNYMSALKQLGEFLPDNNAAENAGEELLAFALQRPHKEYRGD